MGVNRALLWVPLALFALVIAVVAIGIGVPNDHTIRSRMVGKPLPEFALDPVLAGTPGVTSTAFRQGEPRLLNVFASWCVPCAAEAPQLMALHGRGVAIDAVAIRDTPADVRRFLDRYGNPYAGIGDDRTAAVQLALGSSGVPETFVIDGEGRIALQHIGDIRADDVPRILAALEAAR